MLRAKTTGRVLLYQSIGFGVVVAVLWLDELPAVTRVLLGSLRTPVNLGELVLLISLAVAVTWLTSPSRGPW